MKHYYVFSWIEGWEYPLFERTCGTLSAAIAWAKKLNDGFFTVNCLPKRYYY